MLRLNTGFGCLTPEKEPEMNKINFGRVVLGGLLAGLVLGYACIRTRFGPGVKTAIIAGLFAWFAVYFYSGIINSVFIGIPGGTIVLLLVWGLVEYSLGAIAGAWLYKEG